jgi:hypothetical protein
LDSIAISSAQEGRELDSFASLSLNATDAAAPSHPAGERPTGLLTSGVSTSTADNVPESHITTGGEFPPVPEPPAEIESVPPPEIEPPANREVEPATLAEAVFGGQSADQPAHTGESTPALDPQPFDSDGVEAIEPSLAAAITDNAQIESQDLGSSTEPQPPAAPQPIASAAKAIATANQALPVVLVCASIVSWLLGAFTFGIPSFALAAYTGRLLLRRDARQASLFGAVLIAFAGGVLGIAVSAAWWLSKPPFHWKAW